MEAEIKQKLEGIAKFFDELKCGRIADEIRNDRNVAENIRMGINMNFPRGTPERKEIEEKLWNMAE